MGTRRTRAGYELVNSTSYRRNKHRRHAGVEIEFLCGDWPYKKSEHPHVQIKEDGSVHDEDALEPDSECNCRAVWDCVCESGIWGAEAAIGPLNGDSLFKTIRKFCKMAKQAGGYINYTCGLHVHIDATDLTDLEYRNVHRAFYALESVFLGMVSPSRSNNQWCQPILRTIDMDTRYRTLNNYARESKGTFEFRLHNGTLNPIKICNWVALLLDFVEAFRHISMIDQQLTHLRGAPDRDKLIHLFQTTKAPMALKKYLVRRARKFRKLQLVKAREATEAAVPVA